VQKYNLFWNLQEGGGDFVGFTAFNRMKLAG
jgi:hypothetical protein